MEVRDHLASAPLAGLTALSMGLGPWSALAASAAAVLMDFDHCIDFLLVERRLAPLSEMQRHYHDHVAVKRVYLVFHSWELVLLLAAAGWLVSPWFWGPALGMGVHLAFDQYHNTRCLGAYSTRTLFYFVAYRATRGFRAGDLRTDAAPMEGKDAGPWARVARRIPWDVLFVVVYLAIVIIFNYRFWIEHFPENTLGYRDYYNSLFPLHCLANGEIMQKDFFTEYGPLFILFQLPSIIFLGGDQGALMMNWYVVMPVLSIVLAFIASRILMKGQLSRMIFLSLVLVYGFVSHYSGARYVFPVVALALHSRAVESRSAGRHLLAGVMIGLSLLLGEYGYVALVCYLASAVLVAVHKKPVSGFAASALGIALGVLPLVLYLAYYGVFFDYIQSKMDFYRHIVGGGNSAYGSVFPWVKTQGESFFSAALHFLSLVAGADFIIYYMHIFLYAWCMLKVLFDRKIDFSYRYFLFTFALYGMGSLYRTLSGPGYIAYNLIAPTIIFCCMADRLIRRPASVPGANRTGRVVLAMTVVWFLAAGWGRHGIPFEAPREEQPRVYMEAVGLALPETSAAVYSDVLDYIRKVSPPDEPIYVYPYGYYNYFLDRPFASRQTANPNLAKVVADVRRSDPLVVLNTFNTGGEVRLGPLRGDVSDQTTLFEPDGMCFTGMPNALTTYLLENYRVRKAFAYAAVLEKRPHPVAFSMDFSDIDVLSTAKDGGASGKAVLDPSNGFQRAWRLSGPMEATHFRIAYAMRTAFPRKYWSHSVITFRFLASGKEVSRRDEICAFGKTDRTIVVEGALHVPNTVPVVDEVRVEARTTAPYFDPVRIEVSELLLRTSGLWLAHMRGD